MTRVDARSCFASMRTHLQCEIVSKKKKKPITGSSLSLPGKENLPKLLGAREFGPLRMAIIFCAHANFNI